MDFDLELAKINIKLNDVQRKQFDEYYKFLVDYNNKVNLTAITEYEEVMIKHFFDSLTLNTVLENKNITLCDVGAGAGFPSVPVAIYRNEIKVTIIDSLNKRIVFLNELIKRLGLSNVSAFHSRAEEFVVKKRETFDVCTARAVARLNILAELCLPLVKINGYFIAMKGKTSEEELGEALKAIEVLGGKVEKTVNFELPNNSGSREIIVIKKVKKCPTIYPRLFGVIKNKPIS